MRLFVFLFALVIQSSPTSANLLDEVTHGYANNGGVKIHYVSVGKGPLVVMIHGFPDYWYSWRDQMNVLKEHFQVVAIDQRGYNKSDQPEPKTSYAMRYLVGDVAAVVKHLGRDKATIVGHDWGGAVAWQVALNLPQMTERLIVLNLPHPNGFSREMATNSEQQKNSGYASAFREGSATDDNIFFGGPMTPQSLAGWVTDKAAIAHYVKAFERSSFSAMLNYYKMNYAAPTAVGAPPPAVTPKSPQALPKLPMPVLVFHGLKDDALHSDGLNNTWDWIDSDLTIVTAPNAGHFVQQDASRLVSTTMKWWLLSRLSNNSSEHSQ